jgi:hypothetical protein
MPAVPPRRKVRDKLLTHAEMVNAAMKDLERLRKKGMVS